MNKLSIGLSPEGKFKRKLTDKIHNGLRCYEIVDGVITGMAFVTTPAHSEYAAIMSEEKRTIGGPALIPDKMLFRIHPITGEEHYIFFTMDVIEKLTKGYKKQIWSNEELATIVDLFVEGKTTREISNAIKREEEEVDFIIKVKGESFVNMVLILMLQRNKTDEEIFDALKIKASEIPNIIVKLGGKVERK